MEGELDVTRSARRVLGVAGIPLARVLEKHREMLLVVCAEEPGDLGAYESTFDLPGGEKVHVFSAPPGACPSITAENHRAAPTSVRTGFDLRMAVRSALEGGLFRRVLSDRPDAEVASAEARARAFAFGDAPDFTTDAPTPYDPDEA